MLGQKYGEAAIDSAEALVLLRTDLSYKHGHIASILADFQRLHG